MPERLRIPQSLLDEMVEHARAEAPNECCGMIASSDGEAVRLHRMENTSHSHLRYTMGPEEQLRVEYTEIYDRDLELGAIYHSHTRSEPVPSQTDINLANHPDSLYIIVGLADEAPDVRAFTIRDRTVAPAELDVF